MCHNCDQQKVCPSCFIDMQGDHNGHVWTAELWPSDFFVARRWLAEHVAPEYVTGQPSDDELRAAIVAELVCSLDLPFPIPTLILSPFQHYPKQDRASPLATLAKDEPDVHAHDVHHPSQMRLFTMSRLA